MKFSKSIAGHYQK